MDFGLKPFPLMRGNIADVATVLVGKAGDPSWHHGWNVGCVYVCVYTCVYILKKYQLSAENFIYS